MKAIIRILLLLATFYGQQAFAQDMQDLSEAQIAEINFARSYLACDDTSKTMLDHISIVTPCRKKLAGDFCQRFETLPLGVQVTVAVDLHCQALKSELGEADTALAAETMQEIGCSVHARRILEELRKYWGNENASHALLFFVVDYQTQYAACEAET